MLVNGTVDVVLGVSFGVVATQLDRVVCGATPTWKTELPRPAVTYMSHKKHVNVGQYLSTAAFIAFS